MRFPRILWRYVVREVLQYTTLGFVSIAIILVTQNLLRRLGDLVAVGFSASDVLAVLACLFPMLAAYAVPVSFLFGALLAVGRLSADSEVTSMRACGLGLRVLVIPVLALGVLASLLTGWLMIRVEPASRVGLRRVLAAVASRGAILEPGRFRAIGQRVVFVQGRDRDDTLHGVMIADRSNPERPFVVFAESGRFVFDAETGQIRLRLDHGDLHFESPPGQEEMHRQIAFQSFDYAFDAGQVLSQELKRLRPAEMTNAELRDVLARVARGESIQDLRDPDPSSYALQLHRRFALPLAPVLFALVAVPLGLRPSRGARSFGAFVCALLVFGYYACLSFAQFLGSAGHVSPAVALWLPNAIFLVAGIVLLRRARRSEL